MSPESGATSLGGPIARKWLRSRSARTGLLLLPPGLFPADTLQGAEVDRRVDEGVAVGDGRAVTEFGPLDAQFDRLAVDALGGRALLVDLCRTRRPGRVDSADGRRCWWRKPNSHPAIPQIPSSRISNSPSSPVTVKTTRSQMLVTRSAARSRLWATHSSQVARSMVAGSAMMMSSSSR